MDWTSAFNKIEEVKTSTPVESNNSTINIVSDSNPPVTKPQEETNLNPTGVEENLIEIEVNEEKELNSPDIVLSKEEVVEKTKELTTKPVDQKKAELDFYKHYAIMMDASINQLVLKYGEDTEGLLDELEVRILQYQKDQAVFRVYEQHTRLRRSLVINEKLNKDKEKRRKKDLEYVQFVPGEGLVKAKKVVKKVVKKTSKNIDTKEGMIEHLIAQGLSREQAIKLLS